VKNEFVNALDQMLKSFPLDEENQSKNSFNDQLEEKIIQLKRLDRKRRASKLVEKMIQYDFRKKMSRANMIIRNKFSYKKIVKSLIHMI
jgi:hypothetical protein